MDNGPASVFGLKFILMIQNGKQIIAKVDRQLG